MKRSNEYVYEIVPKSVLAAIAVNALTTGGDYLEEARERLVKEWSVLFQNGIVRQKPPASFSKARSEA